MGYEISWILEEQVVHIQYKDKVTSEELRKSNYMAKHFLMNGDDGNVMHVVVDIADAISFPTDLKNLEDLLVSQNSTKGGWVILVGGNRLARLLTATLSQLTQIQFRAAPTIEDGLAFLAQRDPSLPNLWSGSSSQYRSSLVLPTNNTNMGVYTPYRRKI